MTYAKTVPDSVPSNVRAVSAIDATLAADGTAVSAVGATVADPRPTATARITSASTAPTGGVRTTVLPRVERGATGPALVTAPRPRFEKVRALGEGGVGEVTLVHDHDIRREVAVKRLHPQFNDAISLVRFAEEVRTIGSLEHPNIVPVHDVGVDEDGQHYFVMKYVRGETLEHIIEKLAAGDPAFVAKYPIDQRVEIFRGILRAVQYAHAQGIVHRDIKPANVMVGPYGEVVLMDWGLAKKIRAGESDVDPASLGPDAPPPPAKDDGNERAKLFRTRHGALLGTPAYMSPEQARGQNDRIDERSDIYSLCVMFFEMLTLRHYLADQQTVPAMLTAVVHFDEEKFGFTAHAPGVPAEFVHLVRHGMANDPAKRYASVSAILDRLQNIGEGKIAVECPVTLMKRAGRESLNFVDRHPVFSMGAMTVGALGAISGVVLGVLRLLH